MTTWTDQTAFDFAARKLCEQGTRSMARFKNTLTCAYRGEEGRVCHVGALIPDDQYSPKIENKGPRELDLPCLEGLDRSLLENCQAAHDEADDKDGKFHEQYLRELFEIASDFKLDTTELKALWTQYVGTPFPSPRS